MATPLHFGHRGRWLYGVVHLPPEPTSGAALICGPVGQEALRCHWGMRGIADGLARRGVSAMRFDYSGTGDSWGDLDSVSGVEQWIRDIALAADELRAESGATELLLVGVRLGCLLAGRARTSGQVPSSGLISWDPPPSGATWLEQSRSVTRQEYRRRKQDPHRSGHEHETLLGLDYPVRLLDELSGLRHHRSQQSEIIVVTDPPACETSAQEPLPSEGNAILKIDDRVPWLVASEVSEAIVAPRAQRAIVDLVVQTLTGRKSSPPDALASQLPTP